MLGVEVFDAGDEPAQTGGPAAARRGGDGVFALLERTPEAISVGGAGQTTAQADDGDGLRGGAQRVYLHAGLSARAVMRGELEDVRVVPDRARRHGHAQVALKLAHELDGLQGVQAVLGEGRGGVEIPSTNAQHRRHSPGEPVGDLTRGLLFGLGLGAVVFSGGGLGPGAEHLGAAVEVLHLRRVALDLAACRLGDAAGLKERHGVGLHAVVLGDGGAHDVHELVQSARRTFAQEARIGLSGDDQALFAVHVEGERRAAGRAHGRVAGLHRGLDVLGVMVRPTDDDEVFGAAGDVELAVFVQEAEVAGAQPGALAAPGQRRAEGVVGLLFAAPVADGVGLAAQPDLAHPKRRLLGEGL